MSKNATAILIAAVLVMVGGLLFYKSHHNPGYPTPTPADQIQMTPSENAAAASPQEATEAAIITIGPNGFSPSGVTIKDGGTVIWKNTDTEAHQVNSNPHPTHTDYPPLNTIGHLDPGQEKSLTFPSPGMYGFHDHLNPNFQGQVIVVP